MCCVNSVPGTREKDIFGEIPPGVTVNVLIEYCESLMKLSNNPKTGK